MAQPQIRRSGADRDPQVEQSQGHAVRETGKERVEVVDCRTAARPHR